MLATGALTLVFGKHETSDFLGRLFTCVVGKCAAQMSQSSPPGHLSGQRSQELGSANSVPQTDDRILRLVRLGNSLGLLSAVSQQVQSYRTLLVIFATEVERRSADRLGNCENLCTTDEVEGKPSDGNANGGRLPNWRHRPQGRNDGTQQTSPTLGDAEKI